MLLTFPPALIKLTAEHGKVLNLGMKDIMACSMDAVIDIRSCSSETCDKGICVPIKDNTLYRRRK